jgi:hypothetical protein
MQIVFSFSEKEREKYLVRTVAGEEGKNPASSLEKP